MFLFSVRFFAFPSRKGHPGNNDGKAEIHRTSVLPFNAPGNWANSRRRDQS
jgi:hypothetical protein